MTHRGICLTEYRLLNTAEKSQKRYQSNQRTHKHLWCVGCIHRNTLFSTSHSSEASMWLPQSTFAGWVTFKTVLDIECGTKVGWINWWKLQRLHLHNCGSSLQCFESHFLILRNSFLHTRSIIITCTSFSQTFRNSNSRISYIFVIFYKYTR